MGHVSLVLLLVNGLPFGLDALAVVSSASSGGRRSGPHSGLSHRSGIGTWPPVGALVAAASRARPSAALDERVVRRRESRATVPVPSQSIGGPPSAAPNLGPVPLLPVPWRHDDFGPADLAEAKADRDLTVSVCLPARNEEATVGHIVATVRRTLMEEVALVDEVLVLDDGSTDATAAVASWEGARVVAVAGRAARDGPGLGQGQRDVEVARRGCAATSSAGSTPTSATSAPTS